MQLTDFNNFGTAPNLSHA